VLSFAGAPVLLPSPCAGITPQSLRV